MHWNVDDYDGKVSYQEEGMEPPEELADEGRPPARGRRRPQPVAGMRHHPRAERQVRVADIQLGLHLGMPTPQLDIHCAGPIYICR